MLKYVLFFVGLHIWLLPVSNAQTNIGGHISANTIWYPTGNPYVMNDIVTVDSGVTLEIKPGVIINAGWQFFVYGTLRAIGTSGSLIVFSSAWFLNSCCVWNGIEFFGSSPRYNFATQKGSIVQYCKIEYARSWLDIDYVSAPIAVINTSPLIDHCIFNRCVDALYLNTTDSVHITHNLFLNLEHYEDIYAGYSIIEGKSTYVDLSYNLFYNPSGDDPIGGLWNTEKSSFRNNILANDQWFGGLFSWYQWDYIQNTIVDYSSVLIYDTSSFINNTITRCESYSSVYLPPGCIFNGNNFLRNESPNFCPGCPVYWLETDVVDDYLPNLPQIDASNNYWGTTDSSLIDSFILDYSDDTIYCQIHFTPFLSLPDTAAPVIPPYNVVKTDLGNNSVSLTWEPNLESDLAGYKVYYGNFTGYSFSNSMDVSNSTSVIVTGESEADTISVTAYDTFMDGKDDQLEGHESWFTYASQFPVGVNNAILPITDVSVFPNPFHDHLIFEMQRNLTQPISVIIYDFSGREMLRINQTTTKEIEINTLNWNEGVYFFKLISNDKLISSAKIFCF